MESFFAQALAVRGGRFLEAPIVGPLDADEEPGQLIIVAAGDASLFEDCSSMFNAVAKRTFYIGLFQCLYFFSCSVVLHRSASMPPLSNFALVLWLSANFSL